MPATLALRRTAVADDVALRAENTAAPRWEPLAGQPRVLVKTLWQDPPSGSIAGLMRLEPGARVTSHTHRNSIHHIWVLEGGCSLRGRALGAGACSLVPAGTLHAIEADAAGCTLFYLYRRAELE